MTCFEMIKTDTKKKKKKLVKFNSTLHNIIPNNSRSNQKRKDTKIISNRTH